MTDNKLQYTPPRSIRLDTMYNAKGADCTSSGSSASGKCADGYSAGVECDAGATNNPS
jgi:hypothetical protein